MRLVARLATSVAPSETPSTPGCNLCCCAKCVHLGCYLPIADPVPSTFHLPPLNPQSTWISRASEKQRRGRAGRCQVGKEGCMPCFGGLLCMPLKPTAPALAPVECTLANVHPELPPLLSTPNSPQPGVCFHMYSRQRSDSLADFQLPELRRSPLDEMCLQVGGPCCWTAAAACVRLLPPGIFRLQRGKAITPAHLFPSQQR